MDSSGNRLLKNNQFHVFQAAGNPVEIWVAPMGFMSNINVALIERQSGTVALIDPFNGRLWLKKLAEAGLEPTHILLTHTHIDHTWGVATIRKAFPDVEVHAHAEALYPRDRISTRFLFGRVTPTHLWTMSAHREETFRVGGMEWTITHSPGHAPGHVTLYGHGVFLSGDLLFTMLTGRCDLPGSDLVAHKHSLERARDVLRSLPPDEPLIPGHNYAWIDQTKPAWVSIGEVLEHNQVLQRLG